MLAPGPLYPLGMVSLDMRFVDQSRLIWSTLLIAVVASAEAGRTRAMNRARSKSVAVAVAMLSILALAGPADAAEGGFQHGLIITVDDANYYLAGAPDGPNGALDIPGHTWVQSGRSRLQGKHYNTGPFGAPNWWSSDAPDGALLYIVHGVIDTWSEAKAADYADRGYTHYHELISVDDGITPHPDLVVWLKHHAVSHFNFDGGPAPQFAHEVSPGVDYEFIPNGSNPYIP